MVDAEQWFHCSGIENPADIPSRGMTLSDLCCSEVWLTGPERLSEHPLERIEFQDLQGETLVETCKAELRKHPKGTTHSLIISARPGDVSQLRRRFVQVIPGRMYSVEVFYLQLYTQLDDLA